MKLLLLLTALTWGWRTNGELRPAKDTLTVIITTDTTYIHIDSITIRVVRK